MKTRLVVLLAVVLLMAGFCWSQERTIVTVGGSYWNANYSYQDEDGHDLYDFGTGNLFGPYLSLSHGKWNFGASMYFGKFPMESSGYSLSTSEFSEDMKRTDLNFTLGYRIHPNINVFGGVKYLAWNYEAEYSNYYDDYLYKTLGTISYKETTSGPMFGGGVGGTIPLGSSGMYLFASAAYLVGTMSSEYEFAGQSSSDDESEDIPTSLVAINAGLGYRFPSGLGINVGYRADLYTVTVKEENYYTGLDIEYENNIGVKGVVATVSYTFK